MAELMVVVAVIGLLGVMAVSLVFGLARKVVSPVVLLSVAVVVLAYFLFLG